MISRELNSFFNALLYYSRIPVPKSTVCTEQTLSRAFRYLPLVGILVAAAGSAGFAAASLILPKTVAVLLALIIVMLLTGCLHEDGFADFCDGFGGGQSRESILAIMKDSHIGAYGVLGLIMLLAFKIMALLAIPSGNLPGVFIAAHAISRVYPILLVRSSTYAREGDTGKSQHTRIGIDAWSLGTGIVIGLTPLVFLHGSFSLFFLPISFLLYCLYKNYLRKKIGGFTGDTLGALQQGMEILFYLTFLATARL